MELVTPEEIAQVVVQELRGGNTGREIVQGLDATVMGPSYRGGALRSRALEQLRMVEEQHGVSSIAFELLGPPRLTKLLYEAHLLKHVCDDTLELENYNTAELAMKMQQVVQTNTVLRQTILSVGLPILLCDGSTYLRGNEVLIPLSKGREAVTMSADNVNKWCHDGWIDLRESNARAWQLRLQTIREELAGMPSNVTGSHYDHDVRYWGGFTTVDEGKLAAYLLHNEERGARIKR